MCTTFHLMVSIKTVPLEKTNKQWLSSHIIESKAFPSGIRDIKVHKASKLVQEKRKTLKYYSIKHTSSIYKLFTFK